MSKARPLAQDKMLSFRLISTAVCVPSAEHRSCIPSCYANVSSGTSLHRHSPCIFWGKYYITFLFCFFFPVVRCGFKALISLSADIPAQICASTSGAWPVASDVLSLSWCSGVHAHAAAHVCWACGPERPHGLLSRGGCIPAWINSDDGRRLWCWCSLHRRHQRFHPSE